MRMLSDPVINDLKPSAPVQKAAVLSVAFDWEMGHRLPNHKGACYNLHGHHYEMHVYLAGPVKGAEGAADDGMVIDFQAVKEIVKSLIKNDYDHQFLLAYGEPLAAAMDEYPGVRIVSYIPTAENIALEIKQQLLPHIPQLVGLRLYETPGCFVEV